MEKEGHFMTVWMLLDDAERKRHLLNGLKEACDQASLRQDGRALCPEITTRAMLKQNGMPFVEFVRNLAKGIREGGGEGRVYTLPSEWWQSAVTMPEPWSDEVKFAFKQLSLQRNEFIGECTLFLSTLVMLGLESDVFCRAILSQAEFAIRSMMSVLHDMSHGSPGMKKATDLMTSVGGMALAWAETLASERDKPIIRCENCTKTPKEVGGKAKFMVCSKCRTQLDFVVHYCSQ